MISKSLLSIFVQIILVQVCVLGLPLMGYFIMAQAGLDISQIMYLLVSFATIFTAYSIWLESLYALQPPLEKTSVHVFPLASAIIAAYLPNEADTIVETLDAFMAIDYPTPLQIILAYNSPIDLPVEQTLLDYSRKYPSIRILKVPGSTSKAQNVNYALNFVSGEFVGIFDADHRPIPDSFRKAAHWLHSGYDVVQGHCVISNPKSSWVSRLVAIEFEIIYAVSHIGRTNLHTFGLFGGSNGYWRTAVLKHISMNEAMLTEDIDSSIRAIQAGYRIASDRRLISLEQAPASFRALWNQRMRWAQGWFQVSLEHQGKSIRARATNSRQKMGHLHLLGWREIYPWLSMQMFPILFFWILSPRYSEPIEWFVPIFVVATLFTISSSAIQVCLAYHLAYPQAKPRLRWFLWYFVASLLFYSKLKDTIAIIAQMKELLGHREWKVTPRLEAA